MSTYNNAIVEEVIGMDKDPRYKLKYLELAIKEMYKGEIGIEVVEAVRSLTYKLFEEYTNIIAPTNGGVGSSSFPQTQRELSDGERAKLKYEMLLSSLGGGANLTDMDKYLSETNERPQKDFDILKWWHLSCNRFPILSVMARDLLTIPISSVASESVFSTSGRVLSSFRSSLTPKIAETLICGADWIPKLSEILTHTNDMDEDLEELESFENEIGMYSIN